MGSTLKAPKEMSEVIKFDWEEKHIFDSSYIGNALRRVCGSHDERLQFTLSSIPVPGSVDRIWRMQYEDFAIEWRGSNNVEIAKMGAMNFFTQVLVR